jgi:hypothetical protein
MCLLAQLLRKQSMNINVGGIDRILRASNHLIGDWGYLGIVVLTTGMLQFCGAYTLLGLNTCPMQHKG